MLDPKNMYDWQREWNEKGTQGPTGQLFALLCGILLFLGLILLLMKNWFFGPILFLASGWSLYAGYRNQRRRKEAAAMANGWDSQRNKGGGGMALGICVGMVVLGTMLSSSGSETGGAILIVLAAVILVAWAVARRASAGKPAVRKSTPPPAKPCPNPSQHRHFEAPKPAQKQYKTNTRTAAAPSDNQRRLENAKRLYDAGLLTREEYDAEARRYR